AFSADVHDDVVDCSDVKYGKRTVCGRFGSEVALLVGDVLLVQGYTLLHSACENLLPKQKQEIFGLTLKAVFEMSSAQALERKLTKKTRIDPDEYFEIMRLKGVVAELQCRVGGIIGQADDATLEVLTSFGRTVGMLGTIHDEFNDMLDTSELQHRIKFECPPLPMVYAVQDKKIKTAVENFVKNPSAVSSKVMTKKIAKLVLESKDVYNLKQKINEQTVNPKLNALLTKNGRVGHDVSLLLNLLTSNK
ncbi:MAG: polyprenyl synthetase family protein, partial [Candidatus Bathyarchaeota archaeon]|nr:polyprenyl synthetase family protein [Candidatus Termiticorpusculum sp.]